MTIEKGLLESLYLLTQGTEGQLTLKEARVRDTFMRPLREVFTTFEADKRVIYEKFCKKNEDGTSDISGDTYKFDAAVTGDVAQEMDMLTSETVDLPTPEGLKDILTRSEYKPKVGETEQIDHILSLI